MKLKIIIINYILFFICCKGTPKSDITKNTVDALSKIEMKSKGKEWVSKKSSQELKEGLRNNATYNSGLIGYGTKKNSKDNVHKKHNDTSVKIKKNSKNKYSFENRDHVFSAYTTN